VELEGVVQMGCLNLWLDYLRRRTKRILANQNYVDKFYPHSVLTINLQLSAAYEAELEKFARIWCVFGSKLLFNEVLAMKEIFEVENKDDAVWMAELLSNKYVAENIDRLVYLLSVVKR
jgi:hypothetical protein